MAEAVPVENLSFEKALAELEAIVQKLEQGKVDLEESITIYERGEALKAHCEKKLKEAETQEVAGGKGVKEEVMPEDIGAVVSRWTGVPVYAWLACAANSLASKTCRGSSRQPGRRSGSRAAAASSKTATANCSSNCCRRYWSRWEFARHPARR